MKNSLPTGEAVLEQLSSRRADEVMTAPVVMITEDRLLTEAVDLMLNQKLKRLPVVDGNKQLTGMLSRLDIFQTVMREAPDWKSFTAQKVDEKDLKNVGDILRRDVHSVLPETPISEVIRLIDDNDIQRVAVVDAKGKLLGLISDRDLLRYFKSDQEGNRPGGHEQGGINPARRCRMEGQQPHECNHFN